MTKKANISEHLDILINILGCNRHEDLIRLVTACDGCPDRTTMKRWFKPETGVRTPTLEKLCHCLRQLAEAPPPGSVFETAPETLAQITPEWFFTSAAQFRARLAPADGRATAVAPHAGANSLPSFGEGLSHFILVRKRRPMPRLEDETIRQDALIFESVFFDETLQEASSCALLSVHRRLYTGWLWPTSRNLCLNLVFAPDEAYQRRVRAVTLRRPSDIIAPAFAGLLQRSTASEGLPASYVIAVLKADAFLGDEPAFAELTHRLCSALRNGRDLYAETKTLMLPFLGEFERVADTVLYDDLERRLTMMVATAPEPDVEVVTGRRPPVCVNTCGASHARGYWQDAPIRRLA